MTTLDGVLVARSGFESSFQFRSAVLFGTFEEVGDDKVRYLETLTDTFIPGRVAELRASSRKEIAATVVLRMAIRRITGRSRSAMAGPKTPRRMSPPAAGRAWSR